MFEPAADAEEPGTPVPFIIRSSATGAEERRVLVVHMQSQVTDSRGSPRRLLVQLTDPSDLMLLYSLSLPESDYLVLKREQNLTVDFHGFPEELQHLLRAASADEPRCACFEFRGAAARAALWT